MSLNNSNFFYSRLETLRPMVWKS